MVRNRHSTQWLFPKGHIEEGETDEAAARREILEETGIDHLEYIDDLGTYERYRIGEDGIEGTDELKEMHMYLFAAPKHAELAPTMEIEEARWVPIQKVVEVCGNAKDGAWFISVFDRVRLAVQRD